MNTFWPVYDDREKQALADVLASREWGTRGPKVVEFERRFSEYVGVRYAVAVCNGTLALETALRAVGVGPGDEVIIPAYTFIATASAVLMVGATPIIVDIDPATACMDTHAAEKAITSATKAIIPVHLAGNAADMEVINRIAGEKGIVVIEDAAQAHGAEWKGRKLGSCGDMGCFSFQNSKNMTAGEGGIICTDNKEYADLAWSIHHVGRKKDNAFYRHYYCGSNYRMSEWQAAVLLVQMERLEEQMLVRESNAALLNDFLRGIPGISLLERHSELERHAYHLYIFRYDSNKFNGLSRDEFLSKLNKAGFDALAGYTPMQKQPLFATHQVQRVLDRPICYNTLAFPKADALCEQAVWIKHSFLLEPESEVRRFAEEIQKIQHNVCRKTTTI